MPDRIHIEGQLNCVDVATAEQALASARASPAAANNPILRDGLRLGGTALVWQFRGDVDATTLAEAESSMERALALTTTGAVRCSENGGQRWVKHALGHAFWEKRWLEGQIGFHEGKPNDLLVAHVGRLESERPTPRSPLRVLVPLAGKAADLAWLAERGHEVVGVEFVWDAVTAFFADRPGRVVEEKRIGSHRALGAGNVTLVCADIFDVTPEALGRFDVVYDRAALVALEPSLRARYVEVCRALHRERGSTFLIAFAYDQARMSGPPWSVDEGTVRTLFAGRPLQLLASRTLSTSKRMSDAGIAALIENAYWIGA